MVGLSSALSSALSGLFVASGQSALVSRNISRAGDENYTRKYAALDSFADGTVRLSAVMRNTEQKLLDSMLSANSGAAGTSVSATMLERLRQAVGDVEQDGSIAWFVGSLQQSLRDSEANPTSLALANQAVQTASGLATSLNEATHLIQSVRQDADREMLLSVQRTNSLLSEIQNLNQSILGGNAINQDISELLDQRDAALKDLSVELGIKVVQRPGNDIAVFTESGVTLFDVTARQVSFSPISIYSATTVGQSVMADGVPIVGGSSPMPVTTGRLSGLADVRDRIAPLNQAQMDEVARVLITMFSESDQQAVPVLPSATGLFAYSGSPAVPLVGMVYPGVAGDIRIDSAFVNQTGGNAFLLRDGGRNGAAYVYNPGVLSGYQDRLRTLVDLFDASTSFSAAAGLSVSAAVKSFATQSAGWLEGLYGRAEDDANRADALKSRSAEALMRKTGVNLDEEMSDLLELERSYQASSKVMATINTMFSALFNAV